MDSSDPLVSFIIIALSLLASAFFSGCEIAFVSANRLKIELDNQQGKISAKILSFFYKRPSHFIGTMLVGNNIALVVYGIFMGDVLMNSLSWVFPSMEMGNVLVLLAQTTVSTLVILVTAEFLPKAVFSANPNSSLQLLAVPLLLFFYLLWVIMIVTVGMSEFIIRYVMRVEKAEAVQTFGKVDLDHYVTEVINRHGDDEVDREIQMFQNALAFPNIKARDCMVPRNEIVALDMEEPLEMLHKEFVKTKYSKILIYREHIDNIIGYTHSYELFKEPESIKSILLPIFIVPETMSVQEILKQFIQKKRGIALVVDEFGGTSGMLTIEDVMEEIFGEIEDEHDQDALTEIKLGNSEYMLSGRSEIDLVNEKFDLHLPESSDYDTLGGLILNHLQEIPEVGARLKVENLSFRVETMEGNRIGKVKLKVSDSYD